MGEGYFMRLILPDSKKVYLPGNLTYAERVEIVNQYLKEYEDYFTERWDNEKTRVCLDVMATYLARSKEFKDSGILSANRQAELDQPKQRAKKYSVFSELSTKQQSALGLIDPDDAEQPS
jgi:hypothetical protein